MTATDPTPASPADPHLVHQIAREHPECVDLASVGLSRIELAEQMGLVALGLPLPKGRRDLLVPADRKEAVLREIQGHLDRAGRRNELLARGRRILDGTHLSLHPGESWDVLKAVMTDELPWPHMPKPIELVAARMIDVDELHGLDDGDMLARLGADAQLGGRLQQDKARLAERLWRYADDAGEPEDAWTFAALADRLFRASRNRHDADDILRRWDAEFDVWRRERAEARGRAYVDRHFDFARFEQLFPIARGMGRKLVLVVGPTNSGKTHRAIQALKAGSSGVYLAPLRLLALEVMDRLNREGTPTTLLTGEEEMRVPNARHVSSTIEMLDPERPVDVAVIDELQMVVDPDRGWAWTAALMGVPAQTVYLLGAPEVLPLAERIAAHLGEPLEIIELERKVPLTMMTERLEWSDVQPGDALIAFSRRDVHMIRDTVQGNGLSAAVVYGALAPEVRRREAARFLEGDADVVIATDAIGMGLNLPVRRVLFTALEKFDGAAIRPLTATEVRQIAGRAGRFGKFEAGEFGVVGRGTPQALRALLERPDHRWGPKTPLTVRPTKGMLARLAAYIGTEELALLVDCFATTRTDGSPYRVSDLSTLRRVAGLLDARSLDLSRKLDLLFIPADLDKEIEARLFHAICRAVEADEPLPVGHVVPARVEGLDAEVLEDLSRACDLYYWASRKFPKLFPDRPAVQDRRAAVNRRLSDILSTRARKGRREPPPKAGFRGAPRKRYGPRRR